MNWYSALACTGFALCANCFIAFRSAFAAFKFIYQILLFQNLIPQPLVICKHMLHEPIAVRGQLHIQFFLRVDFLFEEATTPPFVPLAGEGNVGTPFHIDTFTLGKNFLNQSTMLLLVPSVRAAPTG